MMLALAFCILGSVVWGMVLFGWIFDRWPRKSDDAMSEPSKYEWNEWSERRER
jgi:hypothetical protein